MIAFTARGRLRHFDPLEQRLISLEDGDTVQLRDDLARELCSHGWGTAPGIASVEPKTRHVKLVVVR